MPPLLRPQITWRLLHPRSPILARSTIPLFEASRSCQHARSIASLPKATANRSRRQATKPLTYAAAIGLLSVAFTIAVVKFNDSRRLSLDAASQLEEHAAVATISEQLPRFRLSEIRKHDGKSSAPWVIHGNKVYDITEWVPAHPGGDVILRAAGGSIDRYWDIFSIHKTQYVYDILAHYHIGYVDAADLTADGTRLSQSDEIADPFSEDPSRHADLITRTLKPRNAESPSYALAASYLTPNDLFYVRNHMWVPTVSEPEQHALTIELPDGDTKTYSLHDLKTRFPQRSVTAVLQCSGNRRSHMSKESGRKANGLPWDTGAISNAQWNGVLLADVLADAGIQPGNGKTTLTDEVKHVHFSGMEAYAASIPAKKALDPEGDVLLAWGMNGQPLPPDHGFPLRSIVPGHVAARSVKWLNKITLSDEESPSQWQRRDYKCFGPNETKVDWDAAPAIQEMPVQSAITAVQLGAPNQKEQTQPLSLKGYAYSGGGREIIRVDVSLDGGREWLQAHLLPEDHHSKIENDSSHASWAWKRWQFDGVLPSNILKKEDAVAAAAQEDQGKLCTTVVVKATDESYNTQPESHAATWNIRGNLASAWHRVRVCTECAQGQQTKS